MSIWRLVFREIAFRRFAFLLGVLSAAVAVGCLVGQLTLLDLQALRSDRILTAKEKRTKEEMDKLEDDFRKMMLHLGFNIKILPENVNLVDFYAKDYAEQYMPEEYGDRLGKSKVVTVN